jgi:PhoPQ-activated pathogenicity-related protein
VGKPSKYTEINYEIAKWLPYFIFTNKRKFRKAVLSKYAKLVFEEFKDKYKEINETSRPFSKSWATHFIKTTFFKVLNTEKAKGYPTKISILKKEYCIVGDYPVPKELKFYKKLQ